MVNKISGRKRVAAYCRVSTDNSDQANSFASQQRYFEEYINRHEDWTLVGIYADEGLSGTTTRKRVEFLRMIDDAMMGNIDLILTKEISRFARNIVDAVSYVRKLREKGVGIIFALDGINTLEGDSELRLAILASIAQEESRRTSERVKWGQKRQMEKGVVFGRDLLGYDVRNGQIFINEDGAKIVRLIFHKFVNEGKGTHVIARELREEGIMPMRVADWSNIVILRALRNEKYCGDLAQKKTITPDYLSHAKKYNRGEEEMIVIKDHHEPIVSREMWEEAQRILAERAASPAAIAKHSNRYPMSGKLKCGYCGSSYIARYRDRKDGSRYKTWVCLKSQREGAPHIDLKTQRQVGCYGKSLRNADVIYIMYLVVQHLQLNQDAIIANLMEIIHKVLDDRVAKASASSLESSLAAAQKKMKKLVDLYLSDMIDIADYSNRREKYNEEIQNIQQKLDALGVGRDMLDKQEKMLQEIASAIRDIISGLHPEDPFAGELLHRMIVHDRDHVDVYLRLLPHKFSFALKKLLGNKNDASAMSQNITDASNDIDVGNHGVLKEAPMIYPIIDTDVPMSVSKPLSSSKGME